MKYPLDVSVPSCFVNVNIIKELEIYIIEKVCEFSKIEEAEARKNFRISIEDKSGTAERASIKEYSESHFQDDTQSIRLEYSVWSKDRFTIDGEFYNREAGFKVQGRKEFKRNAKRDQRY